MSIDGKSYDLGEDYWRFMVPEKEMAKARRGDNVEYRKIIKPATVNIPGLGKPMEAK